MFNIKKSSLLLAIFILIPQFISAQCWADDATKDCMGNCKYDTNGDPDPSYIGNTSGYQNECTSGCEGGASCSGKMGCDACNQCYGYEHDGSTAGGRNLHKDADGDGEGHPTNVQFACPHLADSLGFA